MLAQHGGRRVGGKQEEENGVKGQFWRKRPKIDPLPLCM